MYARYRRTERLADLRSRSAFIANVSGSCVYRGPMRCDAMSGEPAGPRADVLAPT